MNERQENMFVVGLMLVGVAMLAGMLGAAVEKYRVDAYYAHWHPWPPPIGMSWSAYPHDADAVVVSRESLNQQWDVTQKMQQKLTEAYRQGLAEGSPGANINTIDGITVVQPKGARCRIDVLSILPTGPVAVQVKKP